MASSSSSISYSSTDDTVDLESDKETDDPTVPTSDSVSPVVTSLLERLRSPTPADISRPRKIKTNHPPTGKRRCRGALTSDPKNVSPRQRVLEFNEESLTVSRGHLFCQACREQVSLKRSIISNHIRSSKHQKSKERLALRQAREVNLAESLAKHNSETHLRGETLPIDQQVYRVKVVFL